MASGDSVRASSVRLSLIRWPMVSSIHMRAPPAPQQKERSLERSISLYLAVRRPWRSARAAGSRPCCAGRGSRGRGRSRCPSTEVTGVSLPLATSSLSNWVWWRTSKDPPSCSYSRPIGVEAVRAGRDDLGGLGLVQGLDVLLREHLEDELVAHASRGITGAGLGLAHDRELHAGDVQQFGDGFGRLLGLVVQRPGAADPEQVLDLGEVLDVLRRRSARRSRGPWSTRCACAWACPKGCRPSPGSSASRRPRTGSSTRSSSGSGACR